MKWKNNKSLTTLLVNLILLSGLLVIWADKIERTFNAQVLSIEFFKIIGVNIISFIAIVLIFRLFEKLKIHYNNWFHIPTILTFILSSFLYIHYIKKIYENRIINGKLRQELALKIKPSSGLAYGTKAENLTVEEYGQISNLNWFPKVQDNAENIEYIYEYDGFLSDYSFTLSYNLPVESKIDTIEREKGELQIERVGNKRRIRYSEFEK